MPESGLYYDQPLLAMYQRALQNNGNPKFFNISFSGSISNSPAFPNTFSGSLPASSILPSQNIDAIAPDFENMYALHANVQIEQAIAHDNRLHPGPGFIRSVQSAAGQREFLCRSTSYFCYGMNRRTVQSSRLGRDR